MISNISSVDFNRDYKEAALTAAVSIFEEYLQIGSENYIEFEPVLRDKVYAKFGVMRSRTPSLGEKIDDSYKPDEFGQMTIDTDVLGRNINFNLFSDLLAIVRVEL